MLLIVPTYKCNLRCSYCYERPIQNIPSNEVNREYIDVFKFYNDMKSYFQYVKDHERLGLNAQEYISLIFHGGEPTLVSLDYLFSLKDQFYKAREEILDIPSSESFGMVTNGIRFIEDETYLKEIAPYLRSLAISFDPAGQKEARSPKHGFEDFKNLVYTLTQEYGVRVSIMSQVSESNVNKPEQFVEELSELISIAGDKFNNSRIHHVLNTYINVIGKHYTPRDIQNFFDKVYDKMNEIKLNVPERTLWKYKNPGMTTWGRCSTYGGICNRTYGGYFLMMTYKPNGFSLSCPGQDAQENFLLEDINDIEDMSKKLQRKYIEKKNRICEGCEYKYLCNDCIYEFMDDEIGFFDGVQCKNFYRKVEEARGHGQL